MTARDIRLAASDAVELTELLSFLIDWIDSDGQQLPASLQRFAGHSAYGTPALRADLALPIPARRRRTTAARHQRTLTRP